MTYYNQPLQKQYNTPIQQKILHQNIVDSKVYLSRTSNYILNAIGNDLILKGLDINIINIIDNSTVQVVLNPGLLIQDSTLISIEETVTVDINVRPYDHNNGYLILYTEYQYLNTVQENNLEFKIAYITTDGEHISSDTQSWNPNTNRILLHRFSFRKSPVLTVTQITEPQFSIFNKIYYLQGINNYTNFSERVTDHAIDGSTYGYATDTKAGHVRAGTNLTITDGTLSVPEASVSSSGVTRFANESEALLLEADNLALSPASLRNMILNLKNIEIQIVDPGITLGTAMILS